MGADIVLTSYQQVRMSCPWPDNKVLRGLRKLASSKGNQAPICATAVEDWIEKQREKQGGVLHNINWYRVSSYARRFFFHLMTRRTGGS